MKCDGVPVNQPMGEELIHEVKMPIIDALRIEGMNPEQIVTDAPL